MQALPSNVARLVLENTPSMIVRVLINPPGHAGINGRLSAPINTGFVELKELHAESAELVGDSIAAQGIAFFETIDRLRTFSSSDLASAAE